MRPRFRPRPRKDYRWVANATTWEGLDVGEVVDLPLLEASDWQTAPAREEINVRRIVCEVPYRFRDEVYEFSGPALQVAYAAWAIFIVDKDDTTAYQPLSATHLTEERVLGFGEDHIGFGVGGYAVLGTMQTTATEIPWSSGVHIDLRLNRRVSTEDRIILVVGLDPSLSNTNEEVIGRCTSRVLLQKISR